VPTRYQWTYACRVLLGAAILGAILIASLARTPRATAAEQRRFQIALFNSDDVNYSDLGWLEPNEDQPPAPRHSVFSIPPSALVSDTVDGGWVEKYDNVAQATWPAIDQQVRTSATLLLQLKPRDWTRIDAVLIDEPYWGAARDVDSSDPCSSPGDPGYRRMQTMQRVLANVAAVVRGLPNAEKTRVWINFSEPEMQWMLNRRQPCPVPLNDGYIDVVSLDVYGRDFASIRHYYDYLYANRATPFQQLALIPGTYSQRTPGYSAKEVRDRLQGFFDYADSMNQSCSLPIGRVGVTGSADGCPVWLVAGFWGEAIIRDGRAPIFVAPDSAPIRQKWQAQFRLPRHEADRAADLSGELNAIQLLRARAALGKEPDTVVVRQRLATSQLKRTSEHDARQRIQQAKRKLVGRIGLEPITN
jgi:hypothetical protein